MEFLIVLFSWYLSIRTQLLCCGGLQQPHEIWWNQALSTKKRSILHICTYFFSEEASRQQPWPKQYRRWRNVWLGCSSERKHPGKRRGGTDSEIWSKACNHALCACHPLYDCCRRHHKVSALLYGEKRAAVSGLWNSLSMWDPLPHTHALCMHSASLAGWENLDTGTGGCRNTHRAYWSTLCSPV